MTLGDQTDVFGERGLAGERVRVSPTVFFTVEEVATLLRTTRKAVYAMIERRSLPGVTRIGRRVLIRSADLLDWLDHKSAPSLKE